MPSEQSGAGDLVAQRGLLTWLNEPATLGQMAHVDVGGKIILKL